MKKFFLFLVLLPCLIFAQVPQGVGYQGVATDAAGFELINQSISIRASVISGSATGTIEWQETHNTSTDTFGLFNLTIGQGISTGTGAQSNFADITWGANTHFLKIEMDVNGGTNYSHMGTNQMMSVPYALYAENANIDYDSIATILSNDSTFINNLSFGGNMVFGDFIDLNNILNVHTISSHYFTSDTIRLNEDGFLFFNTNSSSLSSTGSVWAQISSDSLFNSPMLIFGSGNLNEGVVIPVKKDSYLHLIGNQAYWTYPKWLPIINGSGSSSSGGGSNSGSGGGCDFNYPDGLNGIPVIHDFITNGSYTVPTGKNLYTNTIFHNTGDDIFINSKKIWNSGHMFSKLNIILSEGDVISLDTIITTNKIMFGLLVDKKVQSLTYDFLSNGAYTVPSGKNLYIYRIYHNALHVEVNGIPLPTSNNFISDDFLRHHLILKAGDIIDIIDQGSGGFENMFGYLADENYFADCGGGSSSSGDSSSSGSGSGCDIIYPEGYSGEILTYKFSSEYIVPSGKNLTMTWLVKNSTSGGSEILYVNGKKIIPYIGPGGILPYSNQEGDMSLRNPFIFSEGDTLSTWITNQSSSSDMIMNGFLTDKNVESVIHSFCEDNVNYSGGSWQGLFNYTVPNGKKLFIQGFYAKNPSNCDLEVDGNAFLDLDNGLELPSIPMQFSSGQVLSLSNPTSILPEDIHFIGYLADENYFADCGGGGGTSTSTIDSSYIDSLVQYYVSNNTIGGCNIDPFYPDGMEGVDYTNIYITNSTPYTVPANKTFYLYTNYSSGLYINGQLGNVIGGDHFFPIPVGEGIEMNLNGGSIAGYLIDKKFDVINYLGGGTNYTVPNDMYLYVLHTPTSITINSSNGIGPTTLYNNNRARTPLVFQPGDIISSSLGISGLLIPIDYCNQTGSTSINSSNSGGSCDIEFPDGLSSTIVSESISSSNTYSVPSGKSLYITQASVSSSSGQNSLKIDGVEILGVYGSGNTSWTNNSGVIIAPSGSIISSGSSNLGQCQFNGLLVNEGSEVIVEEISSSNTYSVPSGKSLYITQASVSSSSGQNSLKIDGVEILGVYGSGNTSWTNNSGVIIAPSGSIISSGTSNLGQCQINGYLVDSNYFSNCNGGGSSGGNSSSTPNKLIYTIDGF